MITADDHADEGQRQRPGEPEDPEPDDRQDGAEHIEGRSLRVAGGRHEPAAGDKRHHSDRDVEGEHGAPAEVLEEEPAGDRVVTARREGDLWTIAIEDMRTRETEEVKARLKQAGAKLNDIDGVRVNTPDGWWLLRASNTQPVLVARCESANDTGLERLMADLKAALAASGVSLPDEAQAGHH